MPRLESRSEIHAFHWMNLPACDGVRRAALGMCDVCALVADGFYVLRDPGKRASHTDWNNFNGTNSNKSWRLKIAPTSPGEPSMTQDMEGVTKGWLLQCMATMKVR